MAPDHPFSVLYPDRLSETDIADRLDLFAGLSVSSIRTD